MSSSKERSAAVTSARTAATAAALTATLGLAAKAAIDVPLALAIAGLGVLIVIAPSLVPGLAPPM